MTQPIPQPHESYPDPHHDPYSKTVFGFWVYLLTDFIMFAAFFAVYAVLRNSTHGGPSIKDLTHHHFILFQTVLLLTCSFTSGLAGATAHRKNKQATAALFLVTFVLGAIFTSLELFELIRFTALGNGWQRSAFLSAFFTIVGTHAIHMLFALLWTIVLIIPVWRDGIDSVNLRRVPCLKMFWQFLNIIWVLIFTVVYFIGEI